MGYGNRDTENFLAVLFLGSIYIWVSSLIAYGINFLLKKIGYEFSDGLFQLFCGGAVTIGTIIFVAKFKLLMEKALLWFDYSLNRKKILDLEQDFNNEIHKQKEILGNLKKLIQ